MNPIIPTALLIWIFMQNKDSKNAPIWQQNKNMLNIRFNPANNWVGQVGENKGFVVFSDPAYSIRAGYKILASYQKRGINTIRAMIHTFAPPNDNNPTDKYVWLVSSKTGIDPDQPVGSDVFPAILAAMARMETGQTLAASLIDRGVALV